MSANPAFVEELPPEPDAPDWAARNEEVLRLGFDWIERLLAGEDGDTARAAYDAARDGIAAEASPAAIDRISMAFALSPFEEDVLLIALAAEVDGRFGPRYGAAQGRLTAAPASPHLLARLLFGSDRLPREGSLALAPDGTLRRFALIALEGMGDLAVTAGIRVTERVRSLLSGIDQADPLAAALAVYLSPVALADRLDALATRLAGTYAPPLRLQLLGPARSGREALGVAILARLGCGALRIDTSSMTPEEMATVGRECVLGNGGVVLVGNSPALAARLARDLPAPLLVIAGQPVEGLEAVPVIRLPRLEAPERLAMWQRAAPAADVAGLAELAEQFALGPREIDAVAQQQGEDLWGACRELGSRDLEALATRLSPERNWEDMVLPPQTLGDLRALAAQVAQRPRVHRDWGYRQVLGHATGISALFAGPSGVGKTMAAEVIANALSLDLFTVDLSRVASKYIGETEKNLARIFDAADAGGCVLFFDEADALFGKRSEVKDSHDRYANAEISYLLQRMESFAGLAILATNLKSHLDTAFLRRIRTIIDFPVPDVSARALLWRRALPAAAPQSGLDLPALARHELSGGNITTIATNAAFRAADEGVAIGMTHLRDAMAAEYRKLDRDGSMLNGGGR